MRIAKEEVFSPVLSIIGFEDEAEAIRLANDTIYENWPETGVLRPRTRGARSACPRR